MTPFNRRTILLSILAAPTLLRAQTEPSVIFHFYGAENCPPCIAFKRDGLPIVQATGRDVGFDVRENLIARTEDIGQVGVYGPADALLREAGEILGRVYPPIFFITRGDEILSVHGPDWRSALDTAETAAVAG